MLLLATIIEDDPKASSFIINYTEMSGTALRLSQDSSTFDHYLIMLSVKQRGIKNHFWVMTWPGIEPWSPRPMDQYWNYIMA